MKLLPCSLRQQALHGYLLHCCDIWNTVADLIGAMTFSTTTFGITTLSILSLPLTLSICESQHNNSLHQVPLCWVPFCWVPFCWVPLCWKSLCWVTLCWVSYGRYVTIQRISDDLFPAKFAQFTKYFFVSWAAKGGSLLLLYRKRSSICIVPCVSK